MPDDYPRTEGKKNKALPDYASPLNINADKGDKLVPENDMSDVVPSWTSGKSDPDPLGYLKGID